MGMLATPNRSQTAVRRREAGQALVFTALAIVVLMGFAGLGIDMGILRYEKRLQQNAADAAAIAGASNLNFGGVQTAAQSAAAANGFTDNGGGVLGNCTASGAAVGTICVQVSTNGPSIGPHQGQLNYVEAYVSVVQPTYFMRILNISKQVVTARAVAGDIGGPTCIYTTGAAPNQIDINGTINAAGCGIVDDGNLSATGAAPIINASSVGVVGTAAPIAPPANTGIPAAGDPLGYLTALTPPLCTNSLIFNGPMGGTPANFNATPGTYCGISITGNADVTFAPGLYIITQNGFSDTGTGTLTGNGVTFYLGGGPLNLSGGITQTTLTAPTTSPSTGVPPGILFWQAPTNLVSNTITLPGTTDLEGVLYFPAALLGAVPSLRISVTNTPPTVLNIIANSLDVNGGTLTLGNNWSAFGLASNAIPITGPTLVE
jgi:hypothetical protein